jgi:hypothetical protein
MMKPLSLILQDIPAKKAGRTAVSKKKIGEELAPPSDSCPGLVALVSV